MKKKRKGFKKWLVFLPVIILVICFFACDKVSPPTENDNEPDVSEEYTNMTDERWACSMNLQIAINSYGEEPIYLTSGFEDFKPSWSKTGGKITFFRALFRGSQFRMWKTKICVINEDGSGFNELTSGEFANFNQTWTRDGSNLIIFNRYAVDGQGSNHIYLISPNGTVGDEVLISDPRNIFEWAFCGLTDGRIFIDRIDSGLPAGDSYKSFLLTPNPGGIGVYEEISRPSPKYWHKLSVSPSETKVTYMLDLDNNMSSYNDVILYYAKFDLDTLTVYDPVAITEHNNRVVAEYPRWSSDETLIIYDSNHSGTSQIYVYRLSDGVTRRISADPRTQYQFGNFENTPK